MYSLGNIVNTVYQLRMVADGGQVYGSDHFLMYINAESLCCTSEISMILYANYTAIKKKRKRKS